MPQYEKNIMNITEKQALEVTEQEKQDVRSRSAYRGDVYSPWNVDPINYAYSCTSANCAYPFTPIPTIC